MLQGNFHTEPLEASVHLVIEFPARAQLVHYTLK